MGGKFLIVILLLIVGNGARAETEEYIDVYGNTIVKQKRNSSLYENVSLTMLRFEKGKKAFEFRLSEESKKCGDFVLNITGIARHFNSNHDFNERNGGIGGRYYLCNLPEGMYVTFFRLKNSLRGIAYGAGTGFEVEVAEFIVADQTFSLGSGIDYNYINYGVPRMCNSQACRSEFNVEGSLPMPFITLGTRNTRVMLHRLVPNKQIYMFSLLLRF